MTTTNNYESLIGKVGGIEKAKAIVSKAPSNAESYQDGYYIRETPEFMFHNGFHDQWNLTDNNGGWFKKNGFNPVVLDDLRTTIAQYEQLGNSEEFEVGDKIIFSAMGNSVMEYQDCLKMFLSQGLIRHATPAEIAAGHRLEAERHG